MVSEKKLLSQNLPNFTLEIPLWQQNKLVLGADEVGRGAFAGPLITAAVVFPPFIKLEVEIDDSKKLSPKKRELASDWIIQKALAISYGHADVDYINQYGIVKATHHAFKNAISNIVNIPLKVDHLLIDAFFIPQLMHFPKSRQTAIIKGDTLSLSIAAASIIAKVHRDQIMQDLHLRNIVYDWYNNKGYGTKYHRQAIKLYGLSDHHRFDFCH